MASYLGRNRNRNRNRNIVQSLNDAQLMESVANVFFGELMLATSGKPSDFKKDKARLEQDQVNLEEGSGSTGSPRRQGKRTGGRVKRGLSLESLRVHKRSQVQLPLNPVNS